MQLTPEQKQFLHYLQDGRIHNIQSFFELEENGQIDNKVSTKAYHFDELKFVRGSEIKVPKDRDQLIKNLKQFLSLWKILEKKELVFSVPNDDQIIPVFAQSEDSEGSYKPDNAVISMISDFYNKEIIALPSLKQLRKSTSYRTHEELRHLWDYIFKGFIMIMSIVIPLLAFVVPTKKTIRFEPGTGLDRYIASPDTIKIQMNNSTNDSLVAALIDSVKVSENVK